MNLTIQRRLTARVAVSLTLVLALVLLCAGSLALLNSGGADRAAPEGSHYLASVESLDSGESAPADSVQINTLLLCSFLVSLALLLGVGLDGRGSERRLLERLRLPRVIPLKPVGHPLSMLEVFRL